jgi:hypothetical protein
MSGRFALIKHEKTARKAQKREIKMKNDENPRFIANQEGG